MKVIIIFEQLAVKAYHTLITFVDVNDPEK